MPSRGRPRRRREFLRTAVGGAITAGVVQIAPASAQRRQRWRFDTGGPVFSSPSVLSGTVFVGSQSGAVFAVDRETGERQWRFETGGAVNSSPLVAPVAEGSGVNTTATESVFAGCNDHHLYAIDARSGDELWRFETEGQIQGSPVIDDGTVFVTSHHDGIYAIDAATGTERWFQENDSVLFSSPTAVGETVFVRGDNLKALDSQGGWVRWQTEIGSGTYSSPTVADETVYVGDRVANPAEPESNGRLHAVDAESGEKRWAFETDEFVDSSPTATVSGGPGAGGTVFVGGWEATLGADPESRAGSVYAVEIELGEQRWQFETGARVVSSPTVADGAVFAGSWDRSVYALDETDGEPRWQFETGGKVSSSPIVVDGTVYVGSNDGYLYALDGDVDGSSEGSRVQTRTLGHHRTEEIETTLVPEGELDSRSALAVGAGTLVGLLSGGSLLYRSRDS
jgi:outer membrane protein assembly factor BamB